VSDPATQAACAALRNLAAALEAARAGRSQSAIRESGRAKPVRDTEEKP
jgi:hypothetical protein